MWPSVSACRDSGTHDAYQLLSWHDCVDSTLLAPTCALNDDSLLKSMVTVVSQQPPSLTGIAHSLPVALGFWSPELLVNEQITLSYELVPDSPPEDLSRTVTPLATSHHPTVNTNFVRRATFETGSTRSERVEQMFGGLRLNNTGELLVVGPRALRTLSANCCCSSTYRPMSPA